MKIKEGEKLLQPFKDECKNSVDPYLVVHFSRDEDKYDGTHEFMDQFDAMIVIKDLLNEFKITKPVF
jgi:hypothetical protein